MKTRNLAIEPRGNRFKQQPHSAIRLVGKWLQAAGFPPGQRVEVQILDSGLIQLRAQTLNHA